MKKIVALVLSLVMALSLCTVAFAADYKTGDKFYDSKTSGKGYVYTYVKASQYKASETLDNNVAYLVAYNMDKDGDPTGDPVAYYFVADKGGKTLYEDASTVASITRGDEITEANGEKYNYTAVAVDAEKWSCTTTKHDAGYKFTGTDDDTYYAKADDNGNLRLLVDGKIVKATKQDPYCGIKGQHILTVPKAGAKELDIGVYEAYCAACHKTLKWSDKNINGAGALYSLDDNTAQWVITNNKSVAIPNGYELLSGNVYVIGEGTKDDGKKDGIDSAKTFDAGVAMYVGMSLLSVAGGAVVIGKKKEF